MSRVVIQNKELLDSDKVDVANKERLELLRIIIIIYNSLKIFYSCTDLFHTHHSFPGIIITEIVLISIQLSI